MTDVPNELFIFDNQGFPLNLRGFYSIKKLFNYSFLVFVISLPMSVCSFFICSEISRFKSIFISLIEDQWIKNL